MDRKHSSALFLDVSFRLLVGRFCSRLTAPIVSFHFCRSPCGGQVLALFQARGPRARPGRAAAAPGGSGVAVCTRQAHRALSSENTEVVVLTVPVGTTPDFEKLFPDLNVIELA